MVLLYTSLMANNNTAAANKARIECARLCAAVAAGKDPGEYVATEFSSYAEAVLAVQPGQKVQSATVSGGPKRFILVPVRRVAARCHFGECGSPRCTGCGVTL